MISGFSAMKSVRAPDLRGLTLTALAFHGSEGAFTALHELARSQGTPDLARANALDSLGVLTGTAPAFALAEVSGSSNFTLFGDWVADLFQTTL